MLSLAYSKALEAMEFSACRLLVQTPNWISFSPLSRLALFLGRRVAGKDLSILRSFKCNWHTDGNIDLLALSSNIPNLTTLDDRLKERRGPLHMERVILCPLGKFAQYQCLSSEGKDKDAKEIIRKELAEVNIPLPRGTIWIKTIVDDLRKQKASDTERLRVPITQVWPAHITLCQAARGDTSRHPTPKHPADSNPDHLARAQDWLLGQTNRSNEVRTAQNKLDVQASQPPKEASNGDLEIFEESFTPVSPAIVVPDVSGIYPTPSDGLPSQVPDLDQQGTPSGVVDHGTTTVRRDSRSVPGSGIRQNSFSGTDVDMDMFAANDLTEADFNFFDKPDMESPKAFGIAIDEFTGTLAFPTENFEAEVITGTSRTQAEKHEYKVISSVSEQNLEEAKLSPSHHLTTASSSWPSAEHSDGKAQPKLFPHKDTLGDTVKQSIPSRGSFNPLLLKDVGFEGKYGVHGRFGYQGDDFPPSTKDLKPTEQIPKLGWVRAVDGVDSPTGESELTSGIVDCQLLYSAAHSLTVI